MSIDVSYPPSPITRLITFLSPPHSKQARNQVNEEVMGMAEKADGLEDKLKRSLQRHRDMVGGGGGGGEDAQEVS